MDECILVEGVNLPDSRHRENEVESEKETNVDQIVSIKISLQLLEVRSQHMVVLGKAGAHSFSVPRGTRGTRGTVPRVPEQQRSSPAGARSRGCPGGGGGSPADRSPSPAGARPVAIWSRGCRSRGCLKG